VNLRVHPLAAIIALGLLAACSGDGEDVVSTPVAAEPTQAAASAIAGATCETGDPPKDGLRPLPGRAGELWLMDAFDRLISRQPVYACEYEGRRFDCGRPLGLLQASLYLALQRETLGPDLRAHLRSLRLE